MVEVLRARSLFFQFLSPSLFSNLSLSPLSISLSFQFLSRSSQFLSSTHFLSLSLLSISLPLSFQHPLSIQFLSHSHFISLSLFSFYKFCSPTLFSALSLSLLLSLSFSSISLPFPVTPLSFSFSQPKHFRSFNTRSSQLSKFLKTNLVAIKYLF